MVTPYSPLPMTTLRCVTDGTVNGTGTIWGSSVDLRQAHYVAMRVKANSASGTPNLLIQWEVGTQRPSTEGSTDTGWVVPDNMTDPYTALSAETVKYTQFFPPPAPFGRPRIIGNAANLSDTVVQSLDIIIQG